MEDEIVSNSTDILINQMVNFDTMCEYFESFLGDITTSALAYQYIEALKDSNKNDFEYYNTLVQLSAKMDTIINQKSDVVKAIMFLWEDGGYPLVKGNPSFDYRKDYRQSELYKKTIKNQYKNVWINIPDPYEENNYFVCVSRTLNDAYSGDIRGTITIFLNKEYLGEVFPKISIDRGERILLTDNTGMILLDSSGTKTVNKYDNQQVLAHVLSTNTGKITSSIDGSPYIALHATSKKTQMKLIYFIPLSNIDRDIAEVPKMTIIFTLLCTMYAVVIAILVYGDIYKPIGKLIKGINKLGDGEFNVYIDTDRIDELGSLTNNFNHMAGQISELIENIKKEQENKKEIEIRALQAQIMPHFLYNTLNAVKVLARMGRNDDIIQMTVSLISLLRLSISNNNEFITLDEELNYVKSYVKIMEYRYEKKLSVKYDVDESLKLCPMLKFMLQPLVENCIIHAFNGKLMECVINIKIYRNYEDINFEISDNGVGMEADKITEALSIEKKDFHVQFNGIGISNIVERLKLNYGDRYCLKLISKKGCGTTACINIPYISPILK